MLDKVYPKLDTRLNDDKAYMLDCVYRYNIVIICLLSGVYDTISMTIITSEIFSSFSSIIIWFLVDISGDISSQKYNIRLDDVVVSVPTSRYLVVV